MKKKMVIIAVAMMLLATTGAFAIGIGAQAGFSAGAGGVGGYGGAITFKLDSPWVFAANGSFGDGHIGLGVTADMWLANPNLAGPLNYYYGWGLAGAINLVEGSSGIGSFFAGVRVLAGLNLFVLDNFLEFYLQGAWQPGIGIIAGDKVDISPILLSFPINLGFRFWF